MARDLRSEYLNYHSSMEQKRKRASRNAARREMERKGRVTKGDGKDVDHKNGNAHDNSPSNLRIKAKSSNRSFPRNAKAGKR